MDNLPNLFAELPTCIQIILAFLVAVATVSELLHRLRFLRDWPMRRLWPKRDGWSASCVLRDDEQVDREEMNPDRAWNIGPEHRWSQCRTQRIDDYYRLHIKKPRVISRIEAISEGNRYPNRFKLLIKTTDRGNWIEVNEYDAPIDISLIPPRKLIAIQFVITEPKLEPIGYHGPPAWSIYDIKLTEVRLFGRWWRKVIEL